MPFKVALGKKASEVSDTHQCSRRIRKAGEVTELGSGLGNESCPSSYKVNDAGQDRGQSRDAFHIEAS